MVIVVENEHGKPSSNLDEAVYISHSAYTFGEKYESSYSSSSNR